MHAAADLWTSFCNFSSDFFYPSKCAVCRQLADASPCDRCRNDMVPACPNFLADEDPALDFRACAYFYEGASAEAVKRLKYSRCTSLAAFMADAVANRLRDLSLPDDLIVPVPLHRSRRAARGFNQAELLAGGSHGLHVNSRVLRRIRSTRPQASLKFQERQKNLTNAFQAGDAVAGRRIILVDDAVTSGFTARECARSLLAAGAESVGIVAFAGNLE